MREPDHSADAIEAAIGYCFDDPSLLIEALTHKSYANEKASRDKADNDRLEFLGDAVLELGVSRILWDRFPGATAGELTRRRADLVCEERLAEIARSLDLGAALRLGHGEERSGGRRKPRLLASTLEAVMAAVYLDGGTQKAMEVCRRLFEWRVDQEPPGVRDFKSRVQEFLQHNGKRPPRYEVQSCEGPDHARQYEVAAVAESVGEAEGESEVRALGRGRSKAEAEQDSARELLDLLRAGDDPEAVP